MVVDLARARNDLATFGEAVECPIERWQAEALRLGVRVSAIVAPRQSGKSRSLALLAVWWAFRKREQRVLVVSAGEEAARRLLADVRRLVTGSPLLAGSVVDEQAGLVRLSNGSEVRSVPASERQVRGWSVDLLLVDEAAMVPDDLLLGAAIPTTAAREGARIVLASSAMTAAGAFFDHVRLGEAGSPHVRSFRWALGDCWWITPTAIEAARESMSETRFRAEYEGVFASGADALFSRQVLDRATADYLPTSLDALEGPARVLGGVDWGAVNDRSAVVAIARLAGRERVYGVVCAHRWRAGEPLHDVVEDIARSPAHFDTLSIERNGLGEAASEMLVRRLRERTPASGGAVRGPRALMLEGRDLERWMDGLPTSHGYAPPAAAGHRPFRTRKGLIYTTGELKAAVYSALRLLIEQGRLVLPASAVDLLRELLMLRVDLTASGTERIEAGSGHDDLADALMLACGPYRERESGRWRSLLAYYADPRRQMPDAAIDVAAVEGLPSTRTGGGLVVPRVPVLQSVRGPEVTVPAGVELRRRTAAEVRVQELRARVSGVSDQPTTTPKEGTA